MGKGCPAQRSLEFLPRILAFYVRYDPQEGTILGPHVGHAALCFTEGCLISMFKNKLVSFIASLYSTAEKCTMVSLVAESPIGNFYKCVTVR